MAGSIDRYLDQLLSIYFLRPETALWRVFDCLLADEIKMSGNTIDLGCGDGTLSYIMAGGKIINYDVFMDVGHLNTYNNGSDIYNVMAYDAISLDGTDLRHTYSYGVDHKEGLISKAKRFKGFYKDTMVCDLNHPLEIKQGGIDYAFSNILYWLDDLDNVLSNWYSIMKPGGKLILFVPNNNFKEKAWIYYNAPHKGSRRYYNFFNRGYSDLIHHCYNSEVWKSIFLKNKFRIMTHKAYLTDPVMSIWNIGTRPVAPLLISMTGRLSREERQIVKKEWIDYFKEFFRPIVEGEINQERPEEQCAFHFYVLER